MIDNLVELQIAVAVGAFVALLMLQSLKFS